MRWRVQNFRDMHEYSSHPAAILSGGDRSVFVKLSEAAHAAGQFEAELAGLRYLADQAGVLTPAPIGLIHVEGGMLLALEAVQSIERTAESWREIGRTLARIHQVKGEVCGLERQGYFGPLYQDNRPMPGWPAFFIERRLWPRFIETIDSGNLPADTIHRMEKLIARIPHIGLPEGRTCLLHGDAQQNNYISTVQGAMVIDPAVFYGDPEYDLAHIDYFQPVSEEVFHGYRELSPIDPGFPDRRDLYRLGSYLAAVTVEGAAHLDKLESAIGKYE